MGKFKDLASLPENERIKVIAQHIEENPQGIIGVAIESISVKKIDRYISKVMTLAPNSLVHEKVTKGKITVIKFKNKKHYTKF